VAGKYLFGKITFPRISNTQMKTLNVGSNNQSNIQSLYVFVPNLTADYSVIFRFLLDKRRKPRQQLFMDAQRGFWASPLQKGLLYINIVPPPTLERPVALVERILLEIIRLGAQVHGHKDHILCFSIRE
jgi:hypothetical protein